MNKSLAKKLNPIHIGKWFLSKSIWNFQVLLVYLKLFENCDRNQLEKFKDLHKGRTGFIVGNGPSVRIENLEKLHDEITFCFNCFHLAYDRISMRPMYTVSADLGMIENFGAEIVEKSESTVFLAFKTRPQIPGDFVWLGAKYKAPPLVFSKKIYHHVTIGGSSLLVALQIGYFMGIRHFVLYGVDHDFKFTLNENTPDKYCNAIGEGNHFIKNYRFGRSWCPPDVEMIEKSMKWADRFLRKRGGSLINATRGGKLEILQRKSFDEMIKIQCSRRQEETK